MPAPRFCPFVPADTYKYVRMKEWDTKIFTKKFFGCIFWGGIYSSFLFGKSFCMDFEALFCYNEEKHKNIQKA
jgi:hypothetical protein